MKFKSELAKQITETLINDDRTSESAIEVVDNNGVITLMGTATAQDAVGAAEESARGHSGVMSVTTDLQVMADDDNMILNDNNTYIDDPNRGDKAGDSSDIDVIVPPPVGTMGNTGSGM